MINYFNLSCYEEVFTKSNMKMVLKGVNEFSIFTWICCYIDIDIYINVNMNVNNNDDE